MLRNPFSCILEYTNVPLKEVRSRKEYPVYDTKSLDGEAGCLGNVE